MKHYLTLLISVLMFCTLCVPARAELDVYSSKLLEEAVQSARIVMNTEKTFLFENKDIRLRVSGPFPELKSMLLANLADSSNDCDFSENGDYTLYVKASIHKSGFFQQPHEQVKLFLKAEDPQGRIIWSDQVWSPKLRDFDLQKNWLFGALVGSFLLLFFWIVPALGYSMDMTKGSRITLRLVTLVSFSGAIVYYIWGSDILSLVNMY